MDSEGSSFLYVSIILRRGVTRVIVPLSSLMQLGDSRPLSGDETPESARYG